MTTRTRKVITAIDAAGKPFAEIHRETQVGEKWYPDDPVPLELGGEDAAAWQAEFNAAQQAENTAIKAELETLKADQFAATQTLKSDHATTVANLNAQIATLTTALATMTYDRNLWRAKVPPEREVTAKELMLRVIAAAPDAIKKIWSSDDEVAAVATKTLFAPDTTVDLNSPEIKSILDGLVQADLLTAEQVATILA